MPVCDMRFENGIFFSRQVVLSIYGAISPVRAHGDALLQNLNISSFPH
jgi:hypothetical protein